MKVFLLLALAALLFSCATTPPDAPQTSVIKEDFLGVCHAGFPFDEKENATLDELGITWLRIDFHWKNIEKEPGVFDFSRYDDDVSANKAAGRKILGILGFSNPLLFSDGSDKVYVSPDDLPRFLEYVRQTVARFKGRVDAWEIWNEPNIHFRFWEGSDADFFRLVKETTPVIRAADENVTIVAGAVLFAPAAYLKKMWKALAFEGVDAISCHPYGLNPAGSAALFEKFTRTMRSLGWQGELWVTEVGYPTGGIYPTRVDEAQFGSYIEKTLLSLAALGAAHVFWYHFSNDWTRDKRPFSLNSERFFGITYADGTLAGGAEKFRSTADLLRGARVTKDGDDAVIERNGAQQRWTVF